MKISIVTPAYNEEGNINKYLHEVSTEFSKLDYDYEIILVNDGSNDNTLAVALQALKQYPNLKVINFSRNFGVVSAIMCGLKHVSGDCAIIMDADLQHPTKYIPIMIKEFEKGYDMVVPLNKERNGQGIIRKNLSRLFYKIFSIITDVELRSGASEFRLVGKKTIDILLQLSEKNIFLKALYSWSTSNIKYFDYSVEERYSGVSKWSFKSLWNYMLDAIFNFSSFPLRIWLYIGSIIAFGSLLYMIDIIIRKLVFNEGIAGFPTLVTLILFFGGLIIFQIAITGEYIARIYTEVKNRPLYIVKEVFSSEQEKQHDD